MTAIAHPPLAAGARPRSPGVVPVVDDGAAILLCTRETVLNSLRHGCRAGEITSLDFMYRPAKNTLDVHVCDPVPGHNCNWRDALADSGEGLREFSRGLLLIHTLARALSPQRTGAHLTMEFDLRTS